MNETVLNEANSRKGVTLETVSKAFIHSPGEACRSGKALSRRPLLFCFLTLAMATLLFGCVPAATVARMDGFDAQWRGFASLPSDPSLHYETEIKVKVIVVGNPAESGYPGAAATYSHPEGVIRIIGKRIKGKIILAPAVIGHEIQHALQFQDGSFVDPDKMAEFGY